MKKEDTMQQRHTPQPSRQHPAPAPSDPMAEQTRQADQQRHAQQAMAAENERRAAAQAHVEQGSAHIKQPSKARNGS